MLALMKLRGVHNICRSVLVKRTDSKLKELTVETGRPLISFQEARELPNLAQDTGISIDERLSHLRTRLLQFNSERSLIMEDMGSIPFDRDKFLRWNQLVCDAKEIWKEIYIIHELSSGDGRCFGWPC
jgi:hypothetical protein